MPGPTAAFFAPVAGVIGLMAGFWASRGVFQLRADDARVGGFLALAAGIVGAAIAFLVVQATIGIPDLAAADEDALLANQTQFVLIGTRLRRRRRRRRLARRADRLRLQAPTTHGSGRTCSGATAVAAFVLVFAILRLLFGPTGYFSTVDGVLDDGTPDDFLGGANLTSLRYRRSGRPHRRARDRRCWSGSGALAWARRGDNARLFPVWVGGLTTGLVAAAISAPIAAGVFGGVTGGGTDALVALFRTLGLSVFQSAFAQGLTSDPLDKTISYTIVFADPGRPADHGPDDVQPRRDHGRRVTFVAD